MMVYLARVVIPVFTLPAGLGGSDTIKFPTVVPLCNLLLRHLKGYKTTE